MNYYKKENQLIFEFFNELGAQEILKVKKEVVDEIEHAHVDTILFDFSNVTFLDSSGIGFILGRYKQLSALNKQLIIIGVTPAIKKILHLSGVTQLVKTIEGD